MGFPTKSTLIRAIQAGPLNTFHGLTAETAQKHFPESEETQTGHMDQVQKGIRSTKEKLEEEEDEAEMHPRQKEKKRNKKTYTHE